MNPSRLMAAFICCFLFIATKARPAEINGVISITTKDGRDSKLAQVKIGLYDFKTLNNEFGARYNAARPACIYFDQLMKVTMSRYTTAYNERELFKDSIQPDNESDSVKKSEKSSELLKMTNAVDKLHSDTLEYMGYSIYLNAGLCYFHNLPAPLQSTKSDANGIFLFHAGAGSYVIVATTSMQDDLQTDVLYWAVKATVGIQKKINVALNNDNEARGVDIKHDEGKIVYKPNPDSLVTTLGTNLEEYVYSLMHDHDLPWLLDYMQQKQSDEAARALKKERPAATPQEKEAGTTPETRPGENIFASLQAMEDAAVAAKKTGVPSFDIKDNGRTIGGKKLKEWISQISDPDPDKSEEAIVNTYMFPAVTMDLDTNIEVTKVLIQVRNDQRRSFMNRLLACIREAIAPVESDIPDLFEFLKRTRNSGSYIDEFRERATRKLLELKKRYPDEVKVASAKYHDDELGSVMIKSDAKKAIDE